MRYNSVGRSPCEPFNLIGSEGVDLQLAFQFVQGTNKGPAYTCAEPNIR